jgi:hypothetical protein
LLTSRLTIVASDGMSRCTLVSPASVQLYSLQFPRDGKSRRKAYTTMIFGETCSISNARIGERERESSQGTPDRNCMKETFAATLKQKTSSSIITNEVKSTPHTWRKMWTCRERRWMHFFSWSSWNAPRLLSQFCVHETIGNVANAAFLL